MNKRERLIELLEETQEKAKGTIGSMNKGFGAWYADYLLEHDVIPVTKCRKCKWWTPQVMFFCKVDVHYMVCTQ